MGREIERKFLVVGDRWREGATGLAIRQGFLSTVPERTVRVRIMDDRAWLTIKGPSRGMVRPEYEYEIPTGDAAELLEMCERPPIEKTRYTVEHGGREWVVDVFAGANRGLVLAEVELESEDAAVDLPAWAGTEVTDDRRYANARLAEHPFTEW